MHVGLTGLFDKGREGHESDVLDRDEIRRYVRSVLADLPRFRWRLGQSPMGSYFLRDDAQFDLDYHLRFVALPAPGEEQQLKELAGRIYSDPLVRDRPLWQLWCVDGLAANRFALVIKAHHCLVDGVAGIGVVAAMLRTTPDRGLGEAKAWPPVIVPTPKEMLRADVRGRIRRWNETWRGVTRSKDWRAELVPAAGDLVRGASALVRYLWPASATPLNPTHVGTTRRFDWIELDLETVRKVKKAAQATINDVALAVVTGAVRRYLQQLGTDPNYVRFRVMVPVSLHRTKENHIRNEVAMMVTPLPVDESDARRRLERVIESVRAAKRSGQTRAVEFAERLADHTAPVLVRLSARASIALRPFNLIVTNVPGPPIPLYFLGAELLNAIPLVPLYVNQAVGIAILSYHRSLCFGLNADAGSLPRVEEFARCLTDAFLDIEAAYLGG